MCSIQLKCLEVLYKKENSEVMKRIEVENRSQVSLPDFKQGDWSLLLKGSVLREFLLLIFCRSPMSILILYLLAYRTLSPGSDPDPVKNFRIRHRQYRSGSVSTTLIPTFFQFFDEK